MEVDTYALSFVSFERAGVGLLLGHADLDQGIENSPALDLKLTRQIVYANFAHPSLCVRFRSRTLDLHRNLAAGKSTNSSYYPLKTWNVRHLKAGNAAFTHCLFLPWALQIRLKEAPAHAPRWSGSYPVCQVRHRVPRLLLYPDPIR